MATVQRMLMSKIWRDQSPYQGFPGELYDVDMQGWNSRHQYLTDCIDIVRPRIVVEIGVWKGVSTIHMAQHMKSKRHDAAVVAVDTFLGSAEHWLMEEFIPDLSREFGFPTLYKIFLRNVIEADVQEFVVPLPIDSANARQMFLSLDLRPELIHVDGAHDFEGALADFRRWWPVLRPGGVMIIDDYDPDLKVWPSVGRAVDAFLAETAHEKFEALALKGRIFKAADAS